MAVQQPSLSWLAPSRRAPTPSGRGGRRSFRPDRALFKTVTVFVMLGMASCAYEGESVEAAPKPPASSAQESFRVELVRAARAQIGETVLYDARLEPVSYPLGDVSRQRGVGADVVVRAFRDAAGIDLQELVHEDMRRDFGAYPAAATSVGPDPSVDHRIVANLERFLERAGARAPAPRNWRELEPGDVVTWRIDGAGPHIGVVSDHVDPESGRPLIIHNFERGAVEEDFLWAPGLTARFRPDAAALLSASDARRSDPAR